MKSQSMVVNCHILICSSFMHDNCSTSNKNRQLMMCVRLTQIRPMFITSPISLVVVVIVVVVDTQRMLRLSVGVKVAMSINSTSYLI